MIWSDLSKFESWIKHADSTVTLIGQKCTHTHANSIVSHFKSGISVISRTSQTSVPRLVE